MCSMTYRFIHVALTCAQWLTNSYTSHSYVLHVLWRRLWHRFIHIAFTCAQWLTHLYMSHSYVLNDLQIYTHRIHMCSMSYDADCVTDSYTSHSHVHRKSSLYLPLGSVNLVLKAMGTPDEISSPPGQIVFHRVAPGISILSWLNLQGK